MFENLKEGDPVKIGELVIKVSEITSDYGYEFQQNGNYFAMFNAEELELMGATLVKEPRTMSVWEWRKHEKTLFVAEDGLTYKWNNERLMYRLPSNNWRDKELTSASVLESIGTEVLG